MFNYATLSHSRRHFIDVAIKEMPHLLDNKSITRKEMIDLCHNTGMNLAQWLTHPNNSINRGVFKLPIPDDSVIQDIPRNEETDDDIITRIKDTYESMEQLVESVAANTVNSLIISGGAGLGKSHTVNKVLTKVNGESEYNYIFHRGYLRASHLFRLLWENKAAGQTIVIDDCDSIFNDETAMNILKAALELKPVRRIGWGSEKIFEDQDGDAIPRYFDYEGSIIFLTNKDIRGEIAANNRMSPHLSALESRSLVLDMKIKTKREYMIKIKQTVESGMLEDKGFSSEETQEIMEFIETNQDKFSELSLRMVEKVSALYLANPTIWKKLVQSVCFK